MSRLMFVYLSGSEKGKTRIFPQDHVTVGTSDACDLKLVPEEGGVLPEGLLADVYDEGGSFHLVPKHGSDRMEITINGDVVGDEHNAAGYPLRDGDTIHFGHGLSSASVLFQIMPENFSTAQLERRTAPDLDRVSSHPVHPLTATLFVKELTASLWAEVPRRAKSIALIGVGLIFVVIASVAVYMLLTLHRATNRIERLSEQSAQEQAQRQKSQEIIMKQQEEIDRLREMAEQTRLFAQKISERYSPGVCLIVGSYSFVELGSGRVLRYETADDANSNPVDQDGNLLASVDGAGPPVQFDYTGTGFVVQEGIIATNKHVVRPWANDNVADTIQRQGGGFKPQLDTLVAFFPSIQKPFELKELRASPRSDSALCQFSQGDAALPVLPLSTDDPRSIIGEPVVVMGYPTGVDGLLQRIEEAERRDVQGRDGKSVEEIALGLAERGLVRPLTTTGTISDALPGRIVHSAQTTEGGSGSPILDRDGRVIAINSAILTTTDGMQSFGGSNFGVPIKAIYEMLLPYYKPQAKP